MIKQFTLALAFGCLMAGTALAQAPAPAPEKAAPPAATAQPTAGDAKVASTPDACLEAAADLVKSAEGKKLADDKLEKIEDLLIKMEGHCEGKRFPEAHAVAIDIKAMIEKQ